MEWLERFKRWLLAEDDEKKKKEQHEVYEKYEEYEEYEEFEPKVAPIPFANKHLTIRTANIYPKRTVEREIERRKASEGKKRSEMPERKTSRTLSSASKQTRKRNKDHFPFPLIPDELPAQERTQKREVSRKREADRISMRMPYTAAHPSDSVNNRSKEAESTRQISPMARSAGDGKRPFRPTEVISPIYGRKRPEQREKEEETEQTYNTLVHPLTFKKAPDFSEVKQYVKEQEEKSVITNGIEDEKVIVSSTKEKEGETEELPVALERIMPEQKMFSEEPMQAPTSVQANQKLHQSSSWLPRAAEERFLPDSEADSNRSMLYTFNNNYDKERVETSIEGIEDTYKHEDTQKWTGPSTGMSAPVIPQGGTYKKPAFSLLAPPPRVQIEDTEYIEQQRDVLATTLYNFNVNAEVIGAVRGPTVTRYEIQPAPGVKVNKITNLIDDIKLSLAARDIRIEAPIPGRSAVGIEVPNEQSMPVFLRSILESKVFQEAASPLTVALGMDIGGEPIVTDLAKMPHGLIAGATGSGKSVCINSIILSLLYKATPEEVRLLLVDPKMVELAPYNHLPHLVAPVVTDPKQATAALKWAVQEMDSRYEKFAEAGARDISRYNDLMRRAYPNEKEYIMPSIVIIIDELADLMMVAPQDVEEAICRIAQKARACGIHLLVATQRPSVDVITGLIKANIPTRIAFSVSSQTDSRTILDMNGAERLLGRGDMLYLSSGSSKPVRLQGPYVSDDEIEAVAGYVRNQAEPNYLFEKEDLTQAMMSENTDELFAQVVLFCVEHGQASASLLQRNFQIGYNRAARLIDMMEEKGFISGQTGNSKPRDVFLTRTEYDNLFGGDVRRE
jgi:S-DNA-T family DNA segregation ATPase FtsK/SpoIIIE